MERRHYRLTLYTTSYHGFPSTRQSVRELTEDEVRERVYEARKRGDVLKAARLPDDWGQVDTFGGGGGNRAGGAIDAGPCPGCVTHCGAACPNAWDGDEEKRRYS